MEISSDTSVWIDFQTINGLHLPFRLNHIYYMSRDAIADELLSPVGLNTSLSEYGLLSLEVTDKEYFEAFNTMSVHPQLSRYDALALSIAKSRGYYLLSGDKALRKAGEASGITVRGTLWVFDELKREKLITYEEHCAFLTDLIRHNGKKIRLPTTEITKRLCGSEDLFNQST